MKRLFTIIKFTLVLCLIINGLNSFATHLVGGNIGYVYVGPTPGNPNSSRFQIYLDTYMDCTSPNWQNQNNPNGSFPEPAIEIGIYEGVLNPTQSLANTDVLTLVLSDSNAIDPNLPPICDPFNLLSSVCSYIVRYEATIDLDNSSDGYWIIYDRCCRPGGILNLQNSGDQSFVYDTWIPAQNGNLIVNSSAQFTDTLLSYICRTDTAYLSNSAIDPDGDSLVYSLEVPFNGLTGNGQAGANPPVLDYTLPPMNPYSFPPTLTNWQLGYSLGTLLGTGGFSGINPNTGQTTFLTNQTGSYVATVQILEYRNGNIVGVSRRNMLLLADNCPNNNAPNQNISVIDPSAIDPLNYVVEEGDTMCFDLNYDDLDGDLITFEATSPIFDPSITSPAATVISPVQGVGSVSSTICWNTGCNQGRDSAYTIDVMVIDSACPPLQLPQTVYIKVLPFQGPQNIFGDSLFCNTGDTTFYTADTLPNVTYQWSVTGGTIISGNGSPNIGILWNPSSTNGTIELSTTSQFGCIAGPLQKNITLSNVITEAGSTQSYCPGDSVIIGGSPTSQDPNNSISWSPSTGLNNPNIANPTASPIVTTTYTVSVTNSLGCVGTDTVTVNVFEPIASGLLDQYFLCPGSNFQVNASGSQFLWTPSSGLSANNINNPIISPSSSTQYTITFTDANGCNNFDTLAVDVNSVVPTDAGSDFSVCIGDSFIIGGNPTSPPFTSFNWSPNNGMNNDTLANPTVLANSTTTFIVQTSNDTCTGVDSVTVTVNPLPLLTVSDDTVACSYDSVMILATGSGSFLWNNGQFLSDSTIANPLANPDVTTVFKVVLTDGNNCSSEDSVEVTVQQPPIASAGGQFNVCKNIPNTLGGNPTGPPNATYEWAPNFGLNNNTLANPVTTISKDTTYTVTVTDAIGCTSVDTAKVFVFTLSPFGDTTLCKNQTFTPIIKLNNGTGPFTFWWSNGSSLSDSTIINPTIYTGQFVNYFVAATDSNGCVDTVNFSIYEALASTANFDYEVTPSCTGVQVMIDNTSNNADSYQWFVNGSLQSTSSSPELNLLYGSNSEISLVTSSSEGCEDTLTVNVASQSFENISQVEPSNIFTPNGDGINDFFELKTNGDFADCIELTIFNRNGVIVHQSTGGVHTWNGASSVGKKYSDGVYFYIYTINGQEYTGNVTLLRH